MTTPQAPNAPFPGFNIKGLTPFGQHAVTALAALAMEGDCLVLLPNARAMAEFADDYQHLRKLAGLNPALFSGILHPFGDKLPRLSNPLRPKELVAFPASDNDLYSELSPDREIINQRLSALAELLRDEHSFCLVTDCNALLGKLMPKAVFQTRKRVFAVGDEIGREDLLKLLLELGYEREDVVEDRGGYSLRGGILDVFPPHSPAPIRVDFIGDEIESLALVDVETQRSTTPIAALELIPCKEILISAAERKELQGRLKHLADTLGLPREKRDRVLAAFAEGFHFHGIENLLPEIYGQASTLFDYAGPLSAVFLPKSTEVDRALMDFADAVPETFKEAVSRGRLVSPPEQLFVPFTDIQDHLHAATLFRFDDLAMVARDRIKIEYEAVDLLKLRSQEHVLKAFDGSPVAMWRTKLHLYAADNFASFIAVGSLIQAKRVYDLLAEDEALPLYIHNSFYPDRSPQPMEEIKPGTVWIVPGKLNGSVEFSQLAIAVLSERDIFGQASSFKKVKKDKRQEVFNLDLSPGDYVVHLDHGVGIYDGLVKLTIGKLHNDFLLIRYASEDKLYLPVDRMNLIQRYVASEGGGPSLDKLGGKTWEKKREKVEREVKKIATELVRLYAERSLAQGFSYSAPDQLYTELEATFPYEETDQQLQAIEDVLADMQRPTPMDRIVCGDVGFGKTEVAIRAAFKAVEDGKQVAILCPTTVLCFQHYATLKKRFSNFPVRVEMMSRFRSEAENKATAKSLEAGKVDVVVGTHRILAQDTVFRDLGLLVIDEEHKFGVMHKEKIKKFKTNIDVLTLTATPIPRTLHMSLLGLRDISVINTPPVDRQAVKTVVAEFSEDIVKEAIEKELRRGGQIYFVHNRVQEIDQIGTFLRTLLPTLRMTIIHGQMDEERVERNLVQFVNRDVDVLLCTTIVESGLDIPNANTIIINRADMFGLSQLYQLRGRVGRSSRKAYAYLLVPETRVLSTIATKRLEVIEEFSKLGSGFKVASHDLEIRGGGNILGEAQTGHIAAIGLELYTQLLEQEVHSIQGEKSEHVVEPVITINIPAMIPEDFVREQGERLRLYKRFASVATEEELSQMAEELQDRFGRLPEALENFIEIVRIKIIMRRFGIAAMEVSGMVNSIQITEHARINMDAFLRLLEKEHKRVRLTPKNQLVITSKDSSFDTIFKDLRAVLLRIGAEKRG